LFPIETQTLKSNKNPYSDLLFDECLHPLGLFIQPRLRLIICSECNCALLPKSIGRHFSDKHKQLHVPVDQEQILAVAKRWKLADTMPTIKGPILQLSGLPLIQGCVKCPICDGVFSRSTMQVHHSQSHSGVPTFDFNSISQIYAQQLNRGQHKTLFEVIIPSAHQGNAMSNPVTDYLRTSWDNRVPEYFSKALDPQALSSWTKYTN